MRIWEALLADEKSASTPDGWMNDVQRALAIIIIASFAVATLASTMRLLWIGEPDAITDMAKTLQAAMVNMGLIALGFFFGNTMAKMAQDKGQQAVVDKLTSTNPPTGGPVAPLAAPTVVPWWSALTDAEKNVIAANAKDDPRVAAFMTAAASGAATADDLAYLVTKGLLTQDRAAAIQK